MSFLQNNSKGKKLKEIRVRCIECLAEWVPFSRGGLNACPDCGVGYFAYRETRYSFEPSNMIIRIA